MTTIINVSGTGTTTSGEVEQKKCSYCGNYHSYSEEKCRDDNKKPVHNTVLKVDDMVVNIKGDN